MQSRVEKRLFWAMWWSVVWFLSNAGPYINKACFLPEQQWAHGSSLAPTSQMSTIFQLFLQPLASSTKAASGRRHVAGHLVKWQTPRWNGRNPESHPGPDVTLQILTVVVVFFKLIYLRLIWLKTTQCTSHFSHPFFPLVIFFFSHFMFICYMKCMWLFFYYYYFI